MVFEVCYNLCVISVFNICWWFMACVFAVFVCRVVWICLQDALVGFTVRAVCCWFTFGGVGMFVSFVLFILLLCLLVVFAVCRVYAGFD